MELYLPLSALYKAKNESEQAPVYEYLKMYAALAIYTHAFLVFAYQT